MDAPSGASGDLAFLLDCSARKILGKENPEDFLAWFSQSALVIAPAFFGQLPDDPDFLRGFTASLARLIWNRTPLPSNHYNPRPLARPERNQFCLCQSGKKYKHCCQKYEQFEREIPVFSMLLHVLDNTPTKRFSALPFQHMNQDEIGYVAKTWLGEGRAKDAVKLLEALFTRLDKLDARAEFAFDCLLNCYDRLGNPLKKKRLLERGMVAPDKSLRATAMQRQCCIAADRGEYDEAWQLFQQVQRVIPNDPNLSHLEIVILKSQGEHEKARERARFWIARLSKDKTGENAPLIAFLHHSAEDLGGSMLNLIQDDYPSLATFTAMAAALPPLECHYSLSPLEESAGPLMPDADLHQIHAEWGRFAEALAENQPAINWHEAPHWLGWLKRNPLAWQSFDVLRDLVDALHDTEPSLGGMEENLVLPLLQRGVALLRSIVKQHRAEALPIEWGWHENRPALSLVAKLAYFHAAKGRIDQAVELMEWLVTTLNPNDNQGVRGDLIHHYVRTGRTDDALRLAARFPEDYANMSYGHILALYLAGRVDEAVGLLKQTHARYPEVGKMLASANPRRPKINDGFVTIGGKDEAWNYRENNLELWQQSGGLTWLRQILRGGVAAKP